MEILEDIKNFIPDDNLEQNYRDFKEGKLMILAIGEGKITKFATVYGNRILFIDNSANLRFVDTDNRQYSKNIVTCFLAARKYFHFNLSEFIENYRHSGRYFTFNEKHNYYIEGDKYYIFNDILTEVTEKYFISNIVNFLYGLYEFDIKEGDIEEGEIEI